MKIIQLLLLSTLTLLAIESRSVLDPKEAFKVDVKTKSKYIEINFTLGKDIYIYDDKLSIALVKPEKISLKKDIIKSKPTMIHKMKVHDKNFVAVIPLSAIKSKVDSKKITIIVEYQGCSKKGLCYSPVSDSFDILMK